MYDTFRNKKTNHTTKEDKEMFGAILGDIIGSRFEFDRPGWKKDFELLTAACGWTDDSVMTIAIAEALMDAGKDASVDEIEAACTASMQKWGRKYPNAGYGGRFIGWIFSDRPRPYNSWGNGSAMRVSAAGWLYDSLERTREVARATANVSHNHPEGIKGAECTAAVIYMARSGASKEAIEEYVTREFGYDFSETLEQMRARHKHDESCMDSLPKALRSFLDGESYEDVVRNAVSLGGDTDTLAAIAGAMAEAYFGMPAVLMDEVRGRIEPDMREVAERFEDITGDAYGKSTDDSYIDNAPLEAAYVLFIGEQDEEERTKAFMTFLNMLIKRISEDAYVPMPMVDVNDVFARAIGDPTQVKAGDTITIQEEARLRMDTMKDGDGNLWLPLFFNQRGRDKGQAANITIPVAIYDVLRQGLEGDDLKGVVIDPFGNPFVLRKDFLSRFLSDYENWAKENGVVSPGKSSMYYKGNTESDGRDEL